MTDLFGPVFDILPQVGLDYDRESSDGPYQRDCVFRLSDGDAFGHLNAYAAFDTSVEDARNWYRDLSGSAAGLTPLAENLDADWDEGVVLLAEESNGADVQLLARDGVLVLKLSFYLTGGDAADPEAQQAALVTVADGIREAMRR